MSFERFHNTIIDSLAGGASNNFSLRIRSANSTGWRDHDGIRELCYRWVRLSDPTFAASNVCRNFHRPCRGSPSVIRVNGARISSRGRFLQRVSSGLVSNMFLTAVVLVGAAICSSRLSVHGLLCSPLHGLLVSLADPTLHAIRSANVLKLTEPMGVIFRRMSLTTACCLLFAEQEDWVSIVYDIFQLSRSIVYIHVAYSA